MNIRSRKSNHRSKVSLFKALDEKEQPISYFIPLLKEKKTSIRVNALKNLNHIFTYQERDDSQLEDESIVEILCGLISNATDKVELQLTSSVLGLAALHIGPNQQVFKSIKGHLSTIVTDGEDHREVDTLCAALYSLSLACFFSCSDPESYNHTINMIKDVLTSSKKKLVLNSALSSWLLLASKLDTSKIVAFQDLLEKFIEFSRSSFPDIRINSAVGIAFIVDETKYQVQDDEDYDENEDDEDYYEDDEEEEEDYKNKQQESEEEEEEESNEGSAGDDEEEEEYDSEEEEFEVDDKIINVIQDIFKIENEKGKKKLVTRNTLRQIVNTLETGSTPCEVITIGGQQFQFKGWRKYIQLQAIRKLVGPGLTHQWLCSENLQQILQVEIHSQSHINGQRKAFKNSLPSMNKKRTQDLTRDRRSATGIYEHNGGQ